MDRRPCATDADLSALADGTLPAPAADGLLAHLDACPACSASAAGFDGRADEVVRALRAKPIRPRAVGEYDLLERVGGGGMGDVYKARHRRLDRVVAVKLPSAAAGRWPHARERFAREVRLAAGVRHPNLVAAHDAGEHDGVPYLVTEFLDGVDLKTLVRSGGPLPVAEAVGYARQAAAGLGCLHGHGVIHRDVKPSNLMRDGRGVVKVIDFGVARADDADDLTAPREVIGSGFYLAPEQTADPAAADHRADVYGLGCTLVFLLTGRTPAAGGPSLRELRPDVPAGLDRVCRRMLAERPAGRPGSMAVVSRLLAPFARPRPNPRRPLLAAAAAILFIVAFTLLWPKPQPAAPPVAAPPPAVPPPATDFEADFRRANPGFPGPLTAERDGGRIVGLAFNADAVADLGPLRGLTGLRRLDCSGTYPRKGRVTDLAPLRGLPLVELALNDLAVSDLGPLRGMPLTSLRVRNAAVTSLEPLRGMPLERLDCTGTGVADLSPLTGMPLDRLDVYTTKVADLSPLAGMKLRRLNCGSTRVSDLSPLAGMPLVSLVCDKTAVADLGPLRGMPLDSLRFDRTRVTDLSPLRGLPLAKVWLDAGPDRVADVLRDIPTLREVNGRPAAEFLAAPPAPGR